MPDLTVDRHKTLMRRFCDDVMARGRIEVVDEIFAPDYVEHERACPSPDAAGTKYLIGALRGAFPDLSVSIEDLFGEGDRAVARAILRGTHLGDLMGIPPSGKRIAFHTIHIVRFENGRVAEHWCESDTLDLLRQIGDPPA